MAADATTREALVVRVDARQCRVLPDGAETPLSARLRGRLFEERSEDRNPVAVGDRVRLAADEESGDLVIETILPRRNVFARRVAGEEERRQVLATNVDRIVLVASFGTPPFSSITTDRILVAASFARIPVAIVLNKIDLARPRRLQRVRETYHRGGYPVLLCCALDGRGIPEFRALLAGHRSVLYGLSGAGKSTLLNQIEEGLGLRTRAVSESLRSGKHTTTYAQLHALRSGGEVIDTPGVRVFRPAGLPPHELRLHFPEMRALDADCRYPDCLHRGEPGCAVEAALRAGEFPRSRYRSYREILSELERSYGGTAPTEDRPPLRPRRSGPGAPPGARNRRRRRPSR